LTSRIAVNIEIVCDNGWSKPITLYSTASNFASVLTRWTPTITFKAGWTKSKGCCYRATDFVVKWSAAAIVEIFNANILTRSRNFVRLVCDDIEVHILDRESCDPICLVDLPRVNWRDLQFKVEHIRSAQTATT